MNLSRRMLLGGALGGGALASFGGLRAWAGGIGATAPSEHLVLVAPDVDPAFTDSAARNGRVVVADRLDRLTEAAGWLAARPGRRLVGLLSESDGTVLRQLVPTSAPWLALGHHRETGAESRHHVALLPASRGLARHLAADLAASGHGFSVVETGMAAAQATFAPAARAEGWQAALGTAFGRIALGQWRPGDGGPALAFAGSGPHRPRQDVALTSFIVG